MEIIACPSSRGEEWQQFRSNLQHCGPSPQAHKATQSSIFPHRLTTIREAPSQFVVVVVLYGTQVRAMNPKLRYGDDSYRFVVVFFFAPRIEFRLTAGGIRQL